MSPDILSVSLVLDEASSGSVPQYARPGDGGADLRACESLSIAPGRRAIVPCGFSIAIPEGYGGLVVPRSGLAANHGITVLNAPGLIDSGYRGEVKVILLNTDPDEAFAIDAGDRIAQLVIVALPTVEFCEAPSLDETERGAGGFGSTGRSEVDHG